MYSPAHQPSGIRVQGILHSKQAHQTLQPGKPHATARALHPPCASLKMFFMRSMMRRPPAGVSSPMSPVWKKPSLSAYSRCHDVAFKRRSAASGATRRVSCCTGWDCAAPGASSADGFPGRTLGLSRRTEGLLGLVLHLEVALEDHGAADADLAARRVRRGAVPHLRGRLQCSGGVQP